jgi:signal transduction histidine kinase
LLDLTRARLGGTIPIARQSTDLQKLCEEVVLEGRAAHPEAVVEFRPTGNLVGNWDADRLTQVISILVGNAIQHGAGTPVTLTAEEVGDAVILTVHNGGARIPPSLLPSIFEPLTHGGGEAATSSIGMGLFIARAIVSAHGGEIGVRSSSDHGTTFTARLPKQLA